MIRSASSVEKTTIGAICPIAAIEPASSATFASSRSRTRSVTSITSGWNSMNLSVSNLDLHSLLKGKLTPRGRLALGTTRPWPWEGVRPDPTGGRSDAFQRPEGYGERVRTPRWKASEGRWKVVGTALEHGIMAPAPIDSAVWSAARRVRQQCAWWSGAAPLQERRTVF
jgi:hypothetical protein